jgi:hypothetical protein
MSVNVPTVMVSSTFYDLKQIRANIADFLTSDLGYEALLSELNSFPVEPDIDTVENCRRRVEHNADILVLIVGGRYGYVDSKSSRSITNLEYLVARNKGIPIYVFIEKRVLTLLPIWERNQGADFSEAVDDTRLFEFVREIRNVHKVWTHEFENAQQIIAALRIQFAYLSKRGISWHLKLRKIIGNYVVEGLSGKALEIALEKPLAWEYRLFAQLFIDEIEKNRELRREHQIGIVIGVGENINIFDIEAWTRPRMNELQRNINALNTIFNKTAQVAFGAPGESGDIGLIMFVTKQIGNIYRETIEWAQRVKRAAGDDRLLPVINAMSKFPDKLINEIETFAYQLVNSIEQAVENHNSGKQETVNATITFELSNLDEFQDALASLVIQLRG